MTGLHARLIVALALLAAVAGTPLGGRLSLRAQEPAPLTFRSSVEAVQLTVIVTDASGQPVTGLSEADFDILENGVSRPITTFSAVDIPIERTERALGEPDVLGNDGPPGRTYVIAFDDMRPAQAEQARLLMHQFIENYFGPNDMAAVVATTVATASTSVGHEFTNNKRLLLEAIDRYAGGESPTRSEMTIGISGGAGGAGASEARAMGFLSETLREKAVMGGLRQLTELLARTPGRKAVIFVSAKGLQASSHHEDCGCDAAMLVDYRPGGVKGLFLNMNRDYQDALSAATRGNVAFYPVSPGGTTGNYTLKSLAQFTGGFTPTVSINSTAGFERLVRDQSTYYLLGFNAGEERRDGRYIRMEVRVKRPGLQVRSLDGYVAPRRRAQPEKRPPGLRAAVWDAVASPLTTSGVPMRMYAAAFKGKGKEATVEITLEIAATKLNLIESDGAYRGELEIAFAVTDLKSRKWPIWRHRATVALKPETYERVSHTAMRVLCQLPLPQGHYQVRASAGGAALAGSVVYDLIVPDFRDDLSMSGVALTSEHASDTFTVSPHKMLDVAFPAPPTTAREFSSDDTLTLFTQVYENRRKPHTIVFTTELSDEARHVVGRDVTERTVTSTSKQASVYSFSPRLRLDGVPPGRYAIHVDARSSLDPDNRSLSRDIPISVR